MPVLNRVISLCFEKTPSVTGAECKAPGEPDRKDLVHPVSQTMQALHREFNRNPAESLLERAMAGFASGLHECKVLCHTFLILFTASLVSRLGCVMQ